MTTVSNGQISVALDNCARVVSFSNSRNPHGNIIEDPSPLFHAVLEYSGNWETLISAHDATIRVYTEDNAIIAEASDFKVRGETLDIRIRMTLRLEGEKIRFDAVVDNRAEATLVDFCYPCIGAIRTLAGGKPGLLYPNMYGQYYPDINETLAAPDVLARPNVLSETYPYNLSMQWMSLIDGTSCLYLASYDDMFYATTLRAASYDKKPHCTLEIDKMAFTGPGTFWECPSAVAWLYEGVWQQGSEDYAAWAKNWRHPVTPKEWVRDSNGFFLVIMKQQYGDEMWNYAQIPVLYQMAKENGCDNLALFGWFHTGHDFGYPDLEVSPTMGGADMLKQKIGEVRKQGGHVTLYHQGHLMDLGSDFYRSTGHRIALKSRWGTPYYEQYSKSSQSDFLRNYSSKYFAPVCPWCKEWHELMEEKTDWICSFGPDAVIFDQIGGQNPYPCFDRSHGHTNPALAYAQGRIRLLSAIRDRVDAHEDYAFLSETLTDVYAQYLDAVHGIGNSGIPRGERYQPIPSGDAFGREKPEMYRNTFPDTVSTIRNPNVYLTPALVNYSLTYGFRFEMEIRYEADKQEYLKDLRPEWKQYAQKICALRSKYRDLLLRGNYRCDPAIEAANPELCHGVFENNGKCCVVLWNNGGKDLSYRLPGYSPTRCWIGGNEQTSIPDTVLADSILVLFLE